MSNENFRTEAANYLHTAKSCVGSSRRTALQNLWRLSDNDDYKEPLCHPSLNLLPSLRDILETNMGDDVARTTVISIIWYLSRSSACSVLIASSEVRLLPVIVRLFSTASASDRDSDYFMGLFNILINLSLSTDCHTSLLNPELHLISYLRAEVVSQSEDVRPVVVLANFLLTTKSENVSAIIHADVAPLLMQRLVQGGVNPLRWARRPTGMTSWCLAFFTNLACFLPAVSTIRQLNQPVFFRELLKTKTIEGIKATIIVSNVYGKDETSAFAKALLVDNPFILTFLLDLFHYIIRYDPTGKEGVRVMEIEAMGFQYGELKLRAIVSSLKNLSISDENKKIMVTTEMRLFSYALEAISDFIDDVSEYGVYVNHGTELAGGGGQDFESLHHLLELLLQLSFYFENDVDLQSFYGRVTDYHVVHVLERLLALPPHRNVPFESRQFATSLLSRLRPKSLPIPPSAAVQMSSLQQVAGSSHVMFSYSWARNKPFVVALTKRLRELGYDVWRDEEGSAIIPAMSGDIVEAMARAIDHAHTVVIFVSSEYKESVNCRAEAKYARARQQSHGLKIVYVMVDEHYHTRSAQAVDGWLGFMVGSDLWYPLWQASHVDSTAQALADLLGNEAKRSPSSPLPLPSLSPVSPIPAVTTPQASPAPPTASERGELDYAKAWECLSNPVKVADPVALQNLLESLGVVDAADFEGVDEEYFEEIARLLKPAPQKNFRKALRMT